MEDEAEDVDEVPQFRKKSLNEIKERATLGLTLGMTFDAEDARTPRKKTAR